MRKPLIKVIKREEGETKSPPDAIKTKKAKRKKERSVESTIQGWIAERRENDDAESRTRNTEFDAWDTDDLPAETV